MSKDRKLSVFLCHSSNDKPVVRELYQRLKTEGWVDPWLDEEKLYPGQDWDLEIEKAVEAADAVVVCLSNNSVTKEGYIQRELRFVLRIADFKPEGTVFVIPVRLDDCPMPRRLSMWQYVDFFPENRKDWAYQRLFGSLKVRAKKQGISILKPTRESVKEKPVLKEAEILSVPGEVAIDSIDAVQKDRARRAEGVKVFTFAGMEFMLIPKGKFIIGSNEDDSQAYENEKPQHTLEIAYDYWLARTPVTNAQYYAFVKATGGEHPILDWQKKKDHPVTQVSWNDAQKYVSWLNKTQLDGLPQGVRYCLPFEAEWEKAARGVYGNIYPWGNKWDAQRCNSREAKIGSTSPVTQFSPAGDSPFGCANMSGNVWEWTSSLWGKYLYPVDIVVRLEHEDESTSGRRVFRGGSFHRSAKNVRCACRNHNLPSECSNSLGFRVCVSPVESLK